MQMCLYEGKPIYSFDILGKNNIIKLKWFPLFIFPTTKICNLISSIIELNVAITKVRKNYRFYGYD